MDTYVAPDKTTLSLTEVETLGMKAARGAGLDWGMAEEAGFAARWLTDQGLPGCEVLLGYLEARARLAPVSPEVAPGPWHGARNAVICPLGAGAAISDWAGMPEAMPMAPLSLVSVVQPALLLPFVSLLARRRGGGWCVSWPGAELTVAEGGIVGIGRDDKLLIAEVYDVLIETAAGDQPAIAPQDRPGMTPAKGTIPALQAFMLRTTVPASEQSRQGAGAGGSDND